MLKYSDHLKAVLYPENLQEVGNNVEKRLCQTIQHFSYKCQDRIAVYHQIGGAR